MAKKPTYEELEQRVSDLEKETAKLNPAQEALKASEERYRRLVENLEDTFVIFTHTPDGEFTYVGPSMETIFGIAPEQATGRRWQEVIDWTPDSIALAERVIATAGDGKPFEPIEMTYVHQDGSVRTIEVAGHPVTDQSGAVVSLEGIARDITDRKRARERIERVNRLDEKLVGLGNLEKKLRWITDGVVEIFDADFCRIWITKPGDLCDSGCLHAEATQGPHVCRYRERCLHLMASSGRYTHIDGGHRRVPFGCYKIGRVASGDDPKFITNNVIENHRVHDHEWARNLGLVSFAGYRLLSREGKPIGVLALFSKYAIAPNDDAVLEGLANTTAQVIQVGTAQEALRQGEGRYKRITQAVTDYIYTVTVQDGQPVETIHAPACEAVTGYTTEDFDNDPYLWIKMVHKDDREAVDEQAARIHSGEAVGPLEHRIIRNDGETRWVKNTPVPDYDSDGRLLSYDGLIQDITERKMAEEEKRQLETQFQQAQRIEAIGTLAGGIAHDFNNLLMGIQGNVSLMRFDMDSDHPHYDMLKTIEGQVRSGATLTRQLLGYARKGQYEVKLINLNEVVEQSSQAFARTRKQITIHRELAEDLFVIEADQGQIQQIMLNLYVNASDAMPGGGDLTIKTTNVTDQDMKDKPYDAKPDNYVLLTVTDTGSGMDKETQDRIFDPFFTTKDMASGRGIGLGLASAYGIVKAHAGYIDVESEKGKGTTFSIYLPATDRRVEKQAVDVAEQIIKGTGTVLIVDDEEVVLEVGTKLLEKLGYSVLEAESGRKALELYKDNRDRIDIVVLDMVMPDVGGGEAYDKMKEINPDVKVLLSSGYSIEDAGAKEMLDRGCDGFIQKPFSMEQLSQSIQQILGKE